MFFLNPSYLWALLGLTIPIAIHLWSKKEGKTIKIGSIKLLSEADSRQSSSFKLNELLLLLIRLLIISLLVFILAEPQIKLKPLNNPITYLVEPSLANNENVIKIIDAINSDAPVRLLQKGFPELSSDVSDPSKFYVPNYWQLAKDMEMISSDSIIVITSAFSSGLKGKRPQVNKSISWIILDPGDSNELLIEATQQAENVELLSLYSNSDHLSFKKEVLPFNSEKINLNTSKDSLKLNGAEPKDWLALQIKHPIKILLFYDDNFTNEATYIEAAFNAISKHVAQPITIDKIQSTTNLDLSSYACIVWLSTKSDFKTEVKTLYYRPDKLANSMIIKGTSNDVFYLTKALHTENIIDEHLPEQLMMLLDLHPDMRALLTQNDKRVLDQQELNPIIQNVKTDKSYSRILYISTWLWILLALLLISERVISNIRKQ